MLKQMQGFDTDKVEIGQFVKIKLKKDYLFNGLITEVTEEALVIYAHLNSKFVKDKDKFQYIHIWAKEVISIDNSGIIPTVFTDIIHPNLGHFTKK